MTVKSAAVDIHSSFGGVINSASWYLLNALSSLRSPDGRILVEGIYEQVQEPNEREMALIEEYALRTPEELSQVYGLKLPVLLDERKRNFSVAFTLSLRWNIEGFGSGYQGQGLKPFAFRGSRPRWRFVCCLVWSQRCVRQDSSAAG